MAMKVDIDHTLLDLFLVDEVTGFPVGRPIVTSCIVHSSRRILGSQISLEPPSAQSMRQVIKKALRNERGHGSYQNEVVQ
jgi:putative transposase